MAGYNFTDYYYLDPTTGVDSAGYGDSMSSGFATLQYALNNMATDGSVLFIRRGTDELITVATSATSSDHNSTTPGMVCSWPRASVSGVGDFIQGALAVSGVAGLSMSTLAHGSRYFTGPDGAKYLVVDCPATDEMRIDPPYAGTTASGGAFEIWEDELYSLASGLTAGEGADAKATWDADSDDMYVLHCSGGSSSYFYFSACRMLNKQTIRFQGGSSASAMVLDVLSIQTQFKNCQFYCENDDSRMLYTQYGRILLDGCVFKGLDTYDSDQHAIQFLGCNDSRIENTVIISCGVNGIYNAGATFMAKNCKFGYDGGHVYRGYYGTYSASVNTAIRFVDCDFSEAVNEDYYTGTNTIERLELVNDARSGVNKLLLPGTGQIRRVDDTNASETMSLRTGGSDQVLECYWYRYSTSAGSRAPEGVLTDNWTGGNKVFDQKLVVPSGVWAIRYYVQTNYPIPIDSDEIWLEAYHNSGMALDSGNEYVYKSAETVSTRTGNGDWTNYVSVQVDVDRDTLINTRMYYARYSSTYYTWVDPLPVVLGV